MFLFLNHQDYMMNEVGPSSARDEEPWKANVAVDSRGLLMHL